MARPRKQTVDYFPHDTDASDSNTLYIIQTKFGNDGYAFFFKLMQLLGTTPGHYIKFDIPEAWEFLLAKTHVSDDEKAKDILKTLAVLGAIDKELFEHGCIWSDDFIDRVEDVYRRRKEATPEKPYWFLGDDDNAVNDDRNREDASDNPQSKVNESIEDENIERAFSVDENAERVWGAALEEIKGHVSAPNFRTWFDGTTGLSYQDGLFIVGVKSQYILDYLGNNQRSLVKSALMKVLEGPVNVAFDVMPAPALHRVEK